MTSFRYSAAFAVLAMQGLAAQAAPETNANPRSADSAMLANALSGQTLQLTMRGTTVSVIANAAPAEDGCSALISAHAPGMTRKWTRLFRWSETAWAGITPEGATMVSFFAPEGRLPSDRVVFSPGDGAGFRAALSRVASNCRSARDEAERIRITTQGSAHGCYFAGLPGLQLLESSGLPGSSPPRALLTVFARETPEAELQLLLQRVAGNSEAWDQPSVAFTFADPGLKDMRVTQAAFALDGKPVMAQHAVTAYSGTRVRVSVDPFARARRGTASFGRRITASDEVRLTLLDDRKKSGAELHFEVDRALADARALLAAADWSCATAGPAPPPAAHWEPLG